MKIISLTFSNINSLAGTFSVDFTHSAFLDSGIFLITGPTGAGKSTILDAIAYALYGATPRQKTISKSVNEIMSRDFRTCSATVVFEHEGLRYAATTESKRSKGQTPFGQDKRLLESISAEGEHRAIANNATQIKAKIAEITGMPNVEAFCRCMLLAQGAFARLLSMDEGDRAALLSTITQTEQYATIGEAVHERYRAAEEDYRQLHAEEELSHEERAATEKTADAQRRDKEECVAAVKAAEQGLRWWEEEKRLQQQLREAQAERTAAEQEQAAFATSGKLARLEAARRAAPLTPAAQQCRRLTEQRSRQEKELTATCGELASLKPLLETSKAARQEAQDALNAARPALEELRRRIEQELRPAEQALATEQALAKEVQQQAAAQQALYEQKRKAHQAEEQAARNLRAQQEATEQQLAENARYAELPERLADIRTKHQAWALHEDYAEFPLASVAELTEELNKHRKEREHILEGQEPAFYQKREAEYRALLQSAEEQARRQARFETLTATVTRTEEELAATEIPYSNAAKELESCRLNEKYLSELASHAEVLAECYRKFCEGEYDTCPCCGSKERHHAGHHIVGESEWSKAKKALNGAEQAFRKIDAQRAELQRRLSIARTERDTLSADITAARAFCEEQLRAMGLEQVPTDLEELIVEMQMRTCVGEELGHLIHETEEQCRAAAARDELHSALSAFCEEKPAVLAESSTILRALEKRSRDYTRLLDLRRSIAPALEAKEKTAAIAREDEEAARQAKETLTTRTAECQTRCRNLAEALQRDWLGKSSGALAKECRAKEEALQQALTTAADKLLALTHKETELNTLRREQESSLAQLRSEEADSIRRFTQLLAENDFADEAAYLAALLPDAELETLTRTQHALRDALTAANAKAEALAANHARHREQQPTEANEEAPELLLSISKTKEKQAVIEEQLLETLAKLKTDDEKRAHNRHIEAEKKQRGEELERWALLKTILGDSKEGFQKYAQAFTFDALIASANKHLNRLYPRFRLKQAEKLSLSVTDSYLEENEVRTVSNLSGGETFIVSLALALGLSGLRNSRVSIDTLFLDEGFGTLDPENLTRVLQALEQLRMDGKLIGIITHVAAMKERFSPDCTLQVEKRGMSGYSTLCPHPAVKAAPKSPAAEEAKCDK